MPKPTRVDGLVVCPSCGSADTIVLQAGNNPLGTVLWCACGDVYCHKDGQEMELVYTFHEPYPDNK